MHGRDRMRRGRVLLMDIRPEAAEALGVFALVFAGAGAIMADATTGELGHVGVSLVFGFVILAMVYALGHVSGAHFNPAITLAFAATGHFPWHRVPGYVLAQTVGAVVAALLLRAILGPVADVGATRLDGVTNGQGFLLETLATFFLAFVIVGVATDRRAAPGAAGLAIGLTVALGALFAGPFTGASMNPARTLGPAVASGAWDHVWLYLGAPVLGAVLAMATYEALRPGRLAIKPKTALGALGPIDLGDP